MYSIPTSHSITGFHFSIGGDDASVPRVGSPVPVYYNPRWHYPVPLLALELLL